MLLVNFIGAPGAGKSTMAAGLFYRLKLMAWNVEIVTEYTKELIFTDNRWQLSNELEVFAEKHRRLRAMEKVDIVIGDSPLLNSAVYGRDQLGESGVAFVEQVARGFDSLYFSVQRVVDYIPVGRMPDEVGAARVGDVLEAHLERLGLPFVRVDGHPDALDAIVERVEQEARARGLAPLTAQTSLIPLLDGGIHAPGLDTPAHLRT